ncbi:sodium/iodide cotransporter-like [Dermacentor silvarum]|uniref:sodium/iodide cotransporter-like n=1 Tax=Dermacentor silvarum TaxID=543639 RepID=UPI002100FE5A|nr:sodium/iodide cotransporter-like [Dermacentor silvarum]
MALLVEYLVFGIIMALNLCLGVYVSLRVKASRAQTTAEVFLGSRSLRFLPLAASVAASLISSISFVALTGHFYAYGFHFIWSRLLTIPAAPVASHVFLPVMYALRVTSVFQYFRMRFHSAISLTTCLIYILLTLSIGALCIFAASLTLVTVFDLPLLWCNVVIGLSATVYTALGGLRAVVWTDCVQLLFILLGPATIIAKVVLDWRSPATSVQPIGDFDARLYIWNTQFDLTTDENLWALISSMPSAFYRVAVDQVVVQRYLASRTLACAQRTVLTGSVLLVVAYTIELAMALSLVLWFRGCDPQLSGAINNNDQARIHFHHVL